MYVALFRHRLRAPLLLLTLACGCATTKPQPDAYKVRNLTIEGTQQVKEGDIKARILTTATPWWEKFWPFGKGPSYFDPNAWQADLRRIERYYQARGFYQAQVTADPVTPDEHKSVELVARVQEGEPTHIGTVEISGMENLPEEHQRRAKAELPLKPGDIFKEEHWQGVKELIQGRLRELGYAEAEVGGEAQVDIETHEATVTLRVQPGPRYKFGNIFVATDANPKVMPQRIIEQAQGSIHKGDWYSESALAEAQARVFAMGVFGAVKINRGAPDRDSATVPIVVDVREALLRSIRLGGGLGVDPAREEGRVLAEWTNRNIFGGLRRLTLKGRVGYAFLPSVYASLSNEANARSGVVFDATSEFEQPRFLFRDLRLQASLSGEKGLEQAYGFLGGRLRAGVIWQPHPSLSVFPSYNLEVYSLKRYEGGGLTSGVPPVTLGCPPDDTNCLIALSYIDTTITWNRRDDISEPRNGYYAALSVQAGGGPLFGDFTYVRLLPDLRYYRSFGVDQRITLAGKVRVGTLIPFRNKKTGQKQSSIVNRFFSGGGNSMRGFNSERLSPLEVLQTDTGETTTVPVGGNSLFETTVEARYRLTDSITVATFWDTGYVGCNDPDLGRLCSRPLAQSPYHALGLGLRYLTVVGPVRVDVARRLNIGPPLLPDYASSGTCFGLGHPKSNYAGAPEGLCTFQLSIGEAF